MRSLPRNFLAWEDGSSAMQWRRHEGEIEGYLEACHRNATECKKIRDAYASASG